MRALSLFIFSLMIISCTPTPVPPAADTDFTLKGAKTKIEVHKEPGAVMSLEIAKKQMTKVLDLLDK